MSETTLEQRLGMKLEELCGGDPPDGWAEALANTVRDWTDRQMVRVQAEAQRDQSASSARATYGSEHA